MMNENLSPSTYFHSTIVIFFHNVFYTVPSAIFVVSEYRSTVMRELHKLYVKHACREYLENWPDLVKYCGYREDNIPQLQDVNTFLKRKSTLQRGVLTRNPPGNTVHEAHPSLECLIFFFCENSVDEQYRLHRRRFLTFCGTRTPVKILF